MAGTVEGGKKAAATNKAKHGHDFYARIGAKGGRNGRMGGFASTVVGRDGLTGRQRASIAGRKGGLKGRRGKKQLDGESRANSTGEAKTDYTEEVRLV